MRGLKTVSDAVRAGTTPRLIALALAVPMLLAGEILVAPPAGATPPIVVRNVTATETLDPFLPCPDFTILESTTTTRTITDYYDQNGTLVMETQHVSLEGILSNSSDLSKTIPVWGHWTYTFTDNFNFLKIAGLNFETIIDGHHLSFANGYETFDFTTGVFIYRGQNNYVFPDVICNALA